MAQHVGVLQHDLLLHLGLEPTQVRQQLVLRGHHRAHLKDQSMEILIAFSFRATLLKVKQFCLVSQQVANVAELSLNVLTELPPRTHTQHSPSLNRHCAPPRKRFSCQECNGHFDHFLRSSYIANQAKLFHIEQPIGKCSWLTIVFLRLVQLQFAC